MPTYVYTDRFWPKLKRNLLLLFAVMAGVMPPTNTMSRKATPIGALKSPFIENDISAKYHDTDMTPLSSVHTHASMWGMCVCMYVCVHASF